MKRKIIKYIKNNEKLYSMYQIFFGVVLRILGVFLPLKNKILFVSFNGQRYDDSPRAIYEAIIKDEQFKDFELVWAFRKPDEFSIERGRKVNFDSFQYYKEAITSKIWITNVTVERGLKFKPADTLYVNTWHGTPIKKMNNLKNENSFKGVDIFCVQDEYSRNIFKSLYNLKDSVLLVSDYPRNDELLKYSENEKREIRKKLGIQDGKRVILYMPTYRPYLQDEKHNIYAAPPIDLTRWKENLGDEYVVLFRLHYLVEKQLSIPSDGFSFSVTNYDKLADLYAIADIMISDYSSAFFDFCVLERPMLCFAYDKDEYEEKIGLLLSLDELPGAVCENEEQVIREIKSMDYEKAVRDCIEFKKIYAPYAGRATERVIKSIKASVFKE